MSKRGGLLSMALLAALFFVVNRGAYKGYFQDDDLDTLTWAPRVPMRIGYLKALLSPRFQPNNFRPAGALFYYAAERLFGVDFRKWVFLLQAIHLFNVWLVWLLARRMRAPPLAAAAACLFFGLHMALFDAFWKPMYIYDVLCATFCLLSLLFYSQQRWILSLVSLWLAYKSKELAVMLPMVLAAYEWWFGKRRWQPLVPFLAVSLWFGLQGVFLNPNRNNPYTFHFTLPALAVTSVFYASRVLLVPYLGFALPLALFIWRQRRVWFGLAMMMLFFLPLLFLPGRMFPAYCYVPLVGLALALSGAMEGAHPALVAVFFLLWAPLDLQMLRQQRNVTLAHDAQVKEWVTTVVRFAKTAPVVDAVVYAGHIPDFNAWGYLGALRYLLRNPDLEIRDVDETEAKALLLRNRVALLTWNEGLHRLTIRTHSEDVPFLVLDGSEPLWQLGEGWYGLEGAYRWIAPKAVAHVIRPDGAQRFQLRVNAGTSLIHDVGPVTVSITLDDHELEPRTFTRPGWQTTEWNLEPGPAGSVRVTILTSPPYRPATDSRWLGIAVGALGFVNFQ